MHQVSAENQTLIPFLFNCLPGHHYCRHLILNSRLPAHRLYPLYLRQLRYLRQRSFALWMQSLQSGAAVVNLPHIVKSYTPRVIEGMAAGRPVISWEIPDRPRNKALFEHEAEILLYDTPAQLATQIERVLSTPDLATQIVKNASRKLKRFHTIENRVEQIITWLESGEKPTY